MKRFCLLPAFLMISLVPVLAQETKMTPAEEAAYTKTITSRADKIVNTLAIEETSKAAAVRDVIAGQYRDLNNIHTNRDREILSLKKQANLDKEAIAEQVAKTEEKFTKELRQLHEQYLSNLSKHLSPAQVEQVKDGMTYGVLPITYKGYQEMISTLTPAQKAQILAWLTEAREFAMDAESSEKKHAWFGKYKGRINNYLSSEGYDVNKASKEWQARIKEQAAAKN